MREGFSTGMELAGAALVCTFAYLAAGIVGAGVLIVGIVLVGVGFWMSDQ